VGATVRFDISDFGSEVCYRPISKFCRSWYGIVVPIFALILLFGCSPPPEPSLLLPMSYFHASSALADDDFGRAREFLRALAADSTGDLKVRAETAASAADIEAMRASFKTLTEDVAIHRAYPDDYAVAFCSMYKNGSKWIQKREAPIANPYLGKSTPPCGSFVD
jgi:hypothetical protein